MRVAQLGERGAAVAKVVSSTLIVHCLFATMSNRCKINNNGEHYLESYYPGSGINWRVRCMYCKKEGFTYACSTNDGMYGNGKTHDWYWVDKHTQQCPCCGKYDRYNS